MEEKFESTHMAKALTDEVGKIVQIPLKSMEVRKEAERTQLRPHI